LKFQKEAIWRQMKEYKRSVARLEQRVEELESAQTLAKTLANQMDVFWQQASGGCSMMCAHVYAYIECA
jgi:hypothetical protein